MRRFTVAPAQTGQRADVFIAARYPNFSRSSLERLFDKGCVVINGKTIRAGYKPKPGEQLVVDDSVLKQKPAKIKLPVIYEDNDVIVLDKPAGVLTHSKGVLNDEATVASFIASKLDKSMPKTNRAGIVHRLDRATGGVIICAKNAAALKHLQKQFSTRKVKKKYLAIVEGKLEPPQAIIDAPIARNPKKPQTFRVEGNGKPAQTEYKVLKELNGLANVCSLVELKPHTGRTHQLRVHMAYIHHPIIGDNLYGHSGEKLLLHAVALEITLPGGRREVFRAEPPKYFKGFAGI